MMSVPKLGLSVAVIAGLVLSVFAISESAQAAGEFHEEYYGPSHGTPMGDPPDADYDRPPAYKINKAKKYRYRDYDPPVEYGGSVKDDYVEPPYSRKYGRSYRRHRCVHPRDIRYGLKSDGWYDFAGYDEADGLICLRARRRDTGRLYEIELDSCSGLIVSATPLRSRGYRYRRFRSSRWFRDRW